MDIDPKDNGAMTKILLGIAIAVIGISVAAKHAWDWMGRTKDAKR